MAENQTNDKKNNGGAGKFLLGAALGAALGAFASKIIKIKQSEDECECGCDCGTKCECDDEKAPSAPVESKVAAEKAKIEEQLAEAVGVKEPKEKKDSAASVKKVADEKKSTSKKVSSREDAAKAE